VHEACVPVNCCALWRGESPANLSEPSFAIEHEAGVVAKPTSLVKERRSKIALGTRSRLRQVSAGRLLSGLKRKELLGQRISACDSQQASLDNSCKGDGRARLRAGPAVVGAR
jgi:hypothetical protein